MLYEHESVFTLIEYEQSQWIAYAVVNLLLIIFVKLIMPVIKSFLRESRLLDEELIRSVREFYYAKFGPHFLSRNASPQTVIGIFLYFGLANRWLFQCTFLSNLSFAFAALTLVMWKIDLVRQHFSKLLHFVDQGELSNPANDPFTGMPKFQPDLMAANRRFWNSAPDSDPNQGDYGSPGSQDRTPAPTESPDYLPGSSTRVK